MFRRLLVLLPLFSLSWSTLAGASDVEIDIPENANTAWVSNNLNQNGMVLSIRSFHSPDSVDSVLQFYRKLWHREGNVAGFLEDDMIDWKLISQKREKDNIVLQIKPTEQGGSTGFLSIAQINGGSHPIQLNFPLPDNTEQYATTYIEEDGGEVHTMTFITKQTVGTTTAFYRDQLTRKGWSVARDSNVKGSQIMLLNRKDDRVEMVIQKLNDEDTVIFVNRVQKDV